MSEKVVLKFVDSSITLDVNTFTIKDKDGESQCKSISRIMPLGTEVLLAEYGVIGLMTLLSANQSNSKPISVNASLAVVGVGNLVPAFITMGSTIIPKSTSEFAMRHTYDPSNDYSYDKLARIASEDKHLAMAIHISNDKSRSKVGLNLQSMFADKGVLEEANKLRGAKAKSMLFRDKKVEFVNYILTDWTNISSLIL